MPVRSDRNLYLAKDGRTVTEEGSRDSHRLLVAEGRYLDDSAAKFLNIRVSDDGSLRQVSVPAPSGVASPEKPPARSVSTPHADTPSLKSPPLPPRSQPSEI